MTQSLMDAHVTSGSLKGATRVFDYLSSQPKTLPLEVYNVLIKMGAPFPVVSKPFFALKRMNLVPDKYSYSLLVSSACDAGQLNMARDIYFEMVREEEANPSVSLISANVFEMIISAFLRRGDKVQAKKTFDKMVERGIQPSSIIYGEIIKSYRREGTPENLRIADEFIKTLNFLPKEDRKWDKDESKGKSNLV
jgi:pentatricopeptide repeat-containing protein PET309